MKIATDDREDRLNLLNPSPRALSATPEALATPNNIPPSGKRQTRLVRKEWARCGPNCLVETRAENPEVDCGHDCGNDVCAD